MHINLETPDKHTIQAYSDSQVKINNILYQHNIVVSRQGILTDWPIDSIRDLKETPLRILLDYKPEIIIIGHPATGLFAPGTTYDFLAKERIGFECMSTGAACRTYNVLLSEERDVVLGIIVRR